MMIDLHLLSKIAGSDYAFRKGMCSKIVKKSQKFADELATDIDNENYNAAYYRMSHFQSSSSSYCNLNFINFLSQMKFKLKTSGENEELRAACLQVIERLQRGIDSLLERFPDDAMRVA